jgi:hypothetical protein
MVGRRPWIATPAAAAVRSSAESGPPSSLGRGEDNGALPASRQAWAKSVRGDGRERMEAYAAPLLHR